MSTHEVITPSRGLSVHFATHQPKNMMIPNHWHHHLEILHIEKGQILAIRGDRHYDLQVGDFFIVNSGQIHQTKSKGQATNTMLQIPMDFLANSIPDLDQVEFQEHLSARKLNSKREFIDLSAHLDLMREVYNKKEKGYVFMFNAHLNRFLHDLYVHFSTRKKEPLAKPYSKNDQRLKQIILYVDQHYKDPISLKDISGYVALSPEYFCRTFKKEMGMTFIQYVNSVRLSHIYRALLDSNASITELQQQHGFTNYKVFNRMFKEAYGCKPSSLK